MSMEISRRSRDDFGFSVVWVPRSANSLADERAKQSLSLPVEILGTDFFDFLFCFWWVAGFGLVLWPLVL